ncbi:MAG: hypothetical protein VB118_00475 [Oscillospiraceae bacterium]|nr:hypothetical protein [Oscillospiraceae bacterium]
MINNTNDNITINDFAGEGKKEKVSFKIADSDKIHEYTVISGSVSCVLDIPVKGAFALYAGVISGTKSFSVCGKKVFVSYLDEDQTAYKELFCFAGEFDENKITVCSEEKAYIVFLRFEPIDAEKLAIWNSSEDKANLMIDNDGYSDFFAGSFPDGESLCNKVVKKYYDAAGIKQFNFNTLVTAQQNFMSGVTQKYIDTEYDRLGVPKENRPKDQFEVCGPDAKPIDFEKGTRDGDKLAFEHIRSISKCEGAPHAILAEYASGIGAELFVSLRMSAYYSHTYGFLNGTLYYLHPEWRQPDSYEMSFIHPEYRQYIKELLLEIASVPAAKGIILDFTRYPYIFGKELEDIEERKRIALGFMRELRSELPKDKKLAIRIIVPSEEKAESYGIDYKTWIKLGLVDRLITNVQSYENFYDFSKYVALCKEAGIEYYLGITADLSGDDMTKEQEALLKKGLWKPDNTYVTTLQFLIRGYEGYMGGADGIYIFNGISQSEVGGISPKYGYLNNKTEIIKWHEFEYSHLEADKTIEKI